VKGRLNAVRLPVEFWANHYYMLAGDEDRDNEEAIEDYFGVSVDRYAAYYRESMVVAAGEHPNPAVVVDLVNAVRIAVEYADAGEDGHEVRYYLSRPSEPLDFVGHDGANFVLPAFRWSEVVTLSKRGSDPGEGASVLLLLAPAVWIQPEEARLAVGLLTEAWNILRVTMPESAVPLARDIVSNRTLEIRWTNDPQFGWINDGQYSARNPAVWTGPGEHARIARTGVALQSVGAAVDSPGELNA
jgi:hypothetical protein